MSSTANPKLTKPPDFRPQTHRSLQFFAKFAVNDLRKVVFERLLS
tara:strand:- start:423 stop:557 length:135 start_codon:yes stop_codon:yes gene_type:complete